MPRWGDILGTLGAAFTGYDEANQNIRARDEREAARQRQLGLDQRAAAQQDLQTAQWNKTYADTHASSVQSLADAREAARRKSEQDARDADQRGKDLQVEWSLKQPSTMAILKRMHEGTDPTAYDEFATIIGPHSKAADIMERYGKAPKTLGYQKQAAVAAEGTPATKLVYDPKSPTQTTYSTEAAVPGQPGPPTTGAGAGRTTVAQLKLRGDLKAHEFTIGQIKKAQDLLKAHPGTTGLVRGLSAVPGLGGYPAALGEALNSRADPGGVRGRAKVGQITAEIRHAISGAAVTPSENKFLQSFLPGDLDNDYSAQIKMQGLLEWFEAKARSARELVAPPPGAPGADPMAGVDPGLAAEFERETQRLRTKPGGRP